jgi:hypothetical protein
MAIPYVGKCFPTAVEFLAYLENIRFGAWRPRFVTMHHTGGPNLKQWRAWQVREKPVTDEQWMRNLAGYYGSSPANGGPAGGPWSAGPHFFFTPKNFCVLSLPDRRGVHAVSFNAMSWGVECVGDFDSELFTPELASRYAEGLACLHLAASLAPDPFKFATSGLHFHRDDPKTTKTCPGRGVDKDFMVGLIKQKIAALTAGSHEDDDPVPPAESVTHEMGRVTTDDLRIRTDAGAKFPDVGALNKGDTVIIQGKVMNGDTLWYRIEGGYIAGRFVELAK